MTDNFLHGIEIVEVDDGARPIQTSQASIIGLVGTAPIGPVNTPTLITGSRRQAVMTFGEPSAGFTIPDALDAIFDQTGSMVVVINVADPDKTAHQSNVTDEVGTFDESDEIELAHRSVRNVVVKHGDSDTTYTEGSDYSVDYDSGIIRRTSGGAISEGQCVNIAYDYLDGSNVLPGDIIGGIDETTGDSVGLQCLLSAQSVLGVCPRLLIAPYFTHDRVDNNANPVVAELLGIAERLRGIVIADCPNSTTNDALTYRNDWGSPRVYCVYPWGKIYNSDTNTTDVQPLSARVAGLIAKSDNDKGWWCSPSNNVINGITGISKPVDFTLGDTNCIANYVNSQQITTVIQKDGYRLWGNHTLSADPKWTFLSVRRTADMINDSLLEAHLWAIDRNITKTYVDDVCESVNNYLRYLKSIGAILGGKCWAETELNTPDQVTQGKVTFSFDFSPPYPAEHIIFRSQMLDDYLISIFE